jgi:2-oxoglutarate ferredoxin oxidoreductase subunit alpha
MMEHIGLAAMTETPCVFVNVQRGGPSTGLPTLPAQADMMQARWGSHGDYEIIAISPNSPHESYELMVDAFNLSEKYRTPVMFMMDECVGHMTERVVIPKAEEIEVYPRRMTSSPPGEYLPYEPGPDGIPYMAEVGVGHHFHITGLTHDERGYPVMSPDCQKEMIGRQLSKIRDNADDIIRYEADSTDGADVVVVSYGITSRVAQRGVELARREGVKVGTVRLIVVWPFPEKLIGDLAKKIKAFVVPELNMGQMVFEVERCAAGAAKTILVPHAGGGVHSPEDISSMIVEAVR